MQLSTERLILREFEEDDWPDVLAYQSDPLYLRYYAWTDRTNEEVKDFVQMFINQQHAQPRIKFQLAMTLKSEDRLIGNCGVRMDAPDAHEADIGYELASQYWGQGLATEAAREMMRFGFTHFGLHRIWSYCIAENAGSARVLKKIGMQYEGRLRENEYFKDRWWDTLIFGILESEWKQRQQAADS